MKFNIFNKKVKNNDKKKNQKQASDEIRIKVYRLVNNSPVGIADFNAQLVRDSSQNTIMLNEEMSFKEEMVGLSDALISDILYKLESRHLSKEVQLEKVKEAIKNQNTLVSSIKEGYIMKKKERVKVNEETEKSKLRLLKCVKYALEHKKGDGFFETIESDGSRSLTYLIRDGDLIPYWYKTPNSEGEPVMVVPDIVQRRKFWKEATEEAIQDFNEENNTMWKGVLGLITKALYVLMFVGLVVWTFHNARWSADLTDESLQPKIDQMKLEAEQIRLLCSSQIANQMENNGVLIDYAKEKLEQEKVRSQIMEHDKANLNI